MINVLVVDDDASIAKLLSSYMTQAGYMVVTAENGEVALDMMEKIQFNLVILDVSMPKIDGYQLTRDIRTIDEKISIIMVTAKDTFEDKKKGFLSGIDDYLTKPIDLNELGLRITALLRRAKVSAEHKIEIGNICINAETRTIQTPNEILELPRKEFDLLFMLANYPKKIFTRRQLMDAIWGLDADADERTVDVHIRRLREKFENHDVFEIVTVRGLGYKMEVLQSALPC